jgi:hypothetical protein
MKATWAILYNSLESRHCLQGAGQQNTAGNEKVALSIATLDLVRKMYAHQRGRARDVWL